MPTLTVTSETMRLSDELGYWVRPTLLAGGVGEVSIGHSVEIPVADNRDDVVGKPLLGI